MLVYLILIAYILVGQILLKYKIISRKFYCGSVCLLMVLITGLRDENVGMWDTNTVYLPSFRVISTNSIANVFFMEDTQYKFLGFVLYSKLISLISTNENFYILMMAWPFYVCIIYLIGKWSDKPGYSFMVLLGLGFFTYSFSMIRGMLALAFTALALDAALENRWKKFLMYVLLATSFHITALIFLLVYLLNKIKWTTGKTAMIFILLLFFRGIIPSLWKYFVTAFIQSILPAYNYYGNKGGVLAGGILIVYIMIGMVALIKIWIAKGTNNGLRIKIPSFKLRKRKKIRTAILEADRENLLVGMAIIGSIIIFMTVILSEMIRIAMFFGLGSVLLAGHTVTGNDGHKSKIAIQLIEMVQLAIFIIYFIFAALPNMNALPYKFFFQ